MFRARAVGTPLFEPDPQGRASSGYRVRAKHRAKAGVSFFEVAM